MTVVTRLMIGLLAAFWVVAGVLVATNVVDAGPIEGALILGVLMLGNGSALSLAAYLSLRGNTAADIGSLALLGTNAALSVTDQIGALDLVSFGISAGAFVLLGIEMRRMRSRGQLS